MNRFQAIEIILSLLDKSDLALFSTGMISREAFTLDDRASNFYMLGSMGLIASIGLGVALNTEQKVVVFDGDGSILMDLGTLPMVGDLAPKNFLHIVLDNEAYGSTGGQPTTSKDVNLENFAKAAKYKHVAKVTLLKALRPEVKRLLGIEGPSLLLVKVDMSNAPGISRVTHKPEVIRNRFMAAVKKDNNQGGS